MLSRGNLAFFLTSVPRFSVFRMKMNGNESCDPLSKPASECDISLEEEIENGKNKHLVKCQFCPSRILNPGLGVHFQSQFNLPMMTKKKSNASNDEEIQYEKLNNFWQIDDMYTFENICFSNTVDNIKYLACADCEIGPIGYHNMNTKISYVALARVKHVAK